MQIVITRVDISDKPSKTGGYKLAEVSYTTNGRPQTFKVLSFSSPAVFAVISKASPGDVFDVEVGKNAQGYNSWDSIVPGTKSSAAPATASPAGRSSFETPEERQERQRLIVRQSSLAQAIATLTVGSKTQLEPETVMTLADAYTSWVFEKPGLFDEKNEFPE